jgi:methanogenic corrinoid protein MtbC1
MLRGFETPSLDTRQDNRSASHSAIFPDANILEDAIKNHVAAALVRSHSPKSRGAFHEIAMFEPYQPDIETLDSMIKLLVRSDPEAFGEIIEYAATSRESMFTFFGSIVSPIARRLGVLWDEDRIDFLQVTLGAARMQGAVEQLRARIAANRSAYGEEPRLLLINLQSDCHTLGSSIVAACFECAGWLVDQTEVLDHRDVVEFVRDRHYDAVGICVAATSQLELCRRTVAEAKQYTRNGKLVVGVGGPAVILAEELFRNTGCDFLSADAFDAYGKCAAYQL